MIWATVLALALVVAPDPTRVAIVALLISRPRPLVNLLVFWLGGMASGTAIALGSVMLLHDFALMVTQHVASTFAALKSGYVGIVIGACALLIAALLSARLRHRATVAIPSGDSPVLVSEPSPANAYRRLSTRARGALVGGRLWVPFVAGFGSAPPHVEYQVAIAAILTSGAPMVTGGTGEDPRGQPARTRLDASSSSAAPPRHRRGDGSLPTDQRDRKRLR
jgi:hypothetical protein